MKISTAILVSLITYGTALHTECHASWFASTSPAGHAWRGENAAGASLDLRGQENEQPFWILENAAAAGSQLRLKNAWHLPFPKVGISPDLPGWAAAEMQWHDLVFTGPGGTVDVVLNLALTGDMEATFEGGSSNSLPSLVREQLRIEGQSWSVLGNSVGHHGAFEDAALTLVRNSTGMEPTEYSSNFRGVSNGVTWLQIALTNVPVGEPINLLVRSSVRLTLERPDDIAGGPYSVSPVDASSSRTLRLPVGVPVFELPDGYSADSSDGGVFANRYIPPLEFARASGNLIVSWPNDAVGGFVLESTPTLPATASAWTPVDGIVHANSTDFYTAPAGQGTRFFRLRKLSVGE